MNAIDRRVAGFARLYAPMLLVVALLTFVPYYEDDEVLTYRTLWEIVVAAPSGGVAFLLMTVLALGFLAWGVFGPRKIGAPIGIGVTSAVMLVVMLTKVGARDEAEWSDAGQAVIVLASLGILLAVAHLLVLALSRPSTE